MANFNVRVPDEKAVRFDAWAGGRGGRSPALRHLIDQAITELPKASQPRGRLPVRPLKLTVRLSAEDGQGLASDAAAMALTPNAWAAAVIRHRLHGRPTFRRQDETELIAVRAELRRIGVNVNQIARALNTAVLEGKVLELELGCLEALRTEIRTHIAVLGAAFAGNLAYWQGEP
jgi:hypothetical protein